MAFPMIAVAALLQSASPSQIPAFFTGQAILEICGRENWGQCSMYVSGVIDGLFLAKNRPGEATLCRAKLTNREAADRVTEYLKANPDMQPVAASVSVKAALADLLPCEEPNVEVAANVPD
jgi:hypothetical protein